MNRRIGELLRVERNRRAVRPGRQTVLAVVLPVLNMFFCAYSERHLTAGDRTGLEWFLTVECAAVMLLSSTRFVTTLSEIVRSSRILAVGPWSMTAFTALALLRDPLTLGILATAAFALVVILQPPLALLPVVVLSVILLGTGMQLLVGSFLVVAARTGTGGAGMALVVTGAVLGIILWSVSFRADALPFTIPPVLWASTLIAPAAERPASLAASAGLLLLFSPVVLAAAGWTLSRR
jgi:hypothetical protein